MSRRCNVTFHRESMTKTFVELKRRHTARELGCEAKQHGPARTSNLKIVTLYRLHIYIIIFCYYITWWYETGCEEGFPKISRHNQEPDTVVLVGTNPPTRLQRKKKKKKKKEKKTIESWRIGISDCGDVRKVMIVRRYGWKGVLALYTLKLLHPSYVAVEVANYPEPFPFRSSTQPCFVLLL